MCSDILNDRKGRGFRQRFIFYTQKNPNVRICLPQIIPTNLAYPKRSHINSKLCLCYCWFVLIKSTVPKKNPCVFIVIQKIPASFIVPKNPFWPKFQTQKIPRTPISKIGEWAPWGTFYTGMMGREWDNSFVIWGFENFCYTNNTAFSRDVMAAMLVYFKQ